MSGAIGQRKSGQNRKSGKKRTENEIININVEEIEHSYTFDDSDYSDEENDCYAYEEFKEEYKPTGNIDFDKDMEEIIKCFVDAMKNFKICYKETRRILRKCNKKADKIKRKYGIRNS